MLLATPAVWLAWSMIAFCVAILSFVWRSGSTDTSFNPLTPTQALGPRIAISVVFAFGLFNFWMVIRTFGTYSHINVRRDRRRRFGRYTEDKARGRQPAKRHWGLSSDEEGEKEKEKERVRRPGKITSDSVVGLGLTGLGAEGSNAALRQGSPGSAGMILEDIDLEKGDKGYLAGGRMGGLGRPSPKLSPKL